MKLRLDASPEDSTDVRPETATTPILYENRYIFSRDWKSGAARVSQTRTEQSHSKQQPVIYDVRPGRYPDILGQNPR